MEALSPLTLTLSPEDGGEGTEPKSNQNRDALSTVGTVTDRARGARKRPADWNPPGNTIPSENRDRESRVRGFGSTYSGTSMVPLCSPSKPSPTRAV